MTQIRSKEISMVPLDEIKLNPKNRNKHSKDQIARLAEIIEYQGFRQPLMISNQSGLLVAGHGRYAAAKKLKLKEVPVIFQDFDSMEQEIAAGVSDNSIALWAELDLEGINIDLADLGPDFNIDLLGIKNFSIDASDKEGLTDPDDVPETPKESPVCRGELFRLGTHRLLCGDSTSITDVERLMNGEKADMVFTDPPYGINEETDRAYAAPSRVAKGNTFKKIIGDQTIDTALEAFSICDSLSDTVCYWGGNYYAHKLPPSPSWIVWDKRVDDKQRDLNSDCELAYVKHPTKKSVRIFRHLWKGLIKGSENGKARVHPTQKPIALAEWCFEELSQDSKNILDLFLGSGSTLIACEKTNRQCYGMEIDPHYCSVILDRWAAFTGKDPVRLNDDGTETSWAEIKATLKSSLLP